MKLSYCFECLKEKQTINIRFLHKSKFLGTSADLQRVMLCKKQEIHNGGQERIKGPRE